MNSIDNNNNSSDGEQVARKMKDLSLKNSADNRDSDFKNLNLNLLSIRNDALTHINLSALKCNFKEAFGDVKFVCMGGSAVRMKNFAGYIKDYIDYKFPFGQTFENISELADRYAMYKVGPILSLSHGMGCSSISILLNEIMKLVYYAGCKDVMFFRLGTSGGIGLTPGTLVITEEAVDGSLRPEFRQIVLGEEITRKTKLNEGLVKELLQIGQDMRQNHVPGIENVVSGRTMCADDFYEGQGRLDGIFCSYTKDEKMKYLLKCQTNGVVNIEMESLCFSAFMNHANIKGAIVCVTILDRLEGDNPSLSKEMYIEFQERPIKLISEFIKRKLADQQK